MTTFAPTARPHYAVVAWVDDTRVYVELPCKDGPPYVTAYPLTEGGLSTALNLMRNVHHESKSGPYKLGTHPKVRHSLKPSATTHAQRESARNVLKRLKIT